LTSRNYKSIHCKDYVGIMSQTVTKFVQQSKVSLTQVLY